MSFCAFELYIYLIINEYYFIWHLPFDNNFLSVFLLLLNLKANLSQRGRLVMMEEAKAHFFV